MPIWLKRTLVVLAVLVVAGGGAYWWYFADGNPPGTLPAYSIDMAAVRAKAAELPGGKASDVRVETIATFTFPAIAAVGGDGWNGLPMAAFAYQVILPADTIIIDSALNAQQGASLGAKIDDDAYARMDAAMAEATQIVVTHEHPDHLGGIIAYPEPATIAKALRLNKEQAQSVGKFGLTLPKEFADVAPIDYSGMLAIAPGVVLIRAPGHTPGSQMVFVQRADGKELLFIGDIGWTERNVETGKGRPRVLSQFMLNEDRDAVFAELKALQALHAAEPNLMIVPGHDVAEIAKLIAAGGLQAQFNP